LDTHLVCVCCRCQPVTVGPVTDQELQDRVYMYTDQQLCRSKTQYTSYSVQEDIFSQLELNMKYVHITGLAAIAAQIPHLDQFRWPGYYLMIHAAVLAVLVLALFREKRTDLNRGKGNCTVRNLHLAVPMYVSSPHCKCFGTSTV